MSLFGRRKKKDAKDDGGDIVLEDCRGIVCKKEAVDELKYFLQDYVDTVEGFIKKTESKILHGFATIEATGEPGKIVWICKDAEIPIILIKEDQQFSVERNGEILTFSPYDFVEQERYRKDGVRELTTGIRYNYYSKVLTQGKKRFSIRISANNIRTKLETDRRDIDDYLMSLDLDKLPKVQDIAEKVLEFLHINNPEENKKFDIEYSMYFSEFVARTIIKNGLKQQIGNMDDEKHVYNLYYDRSWSFSKPEFEISFNVSPEPGKVTYVTGLKNLDFSPAQEFEQVQKKVEELFAKLF